MVGKDRRAITAHHQFSHLPMSRAIRQRIQRLVMILVGLVILQIAMLMVVEDMTLLEAFWLTLTTLATVGYGDLSPATHTGRLITVVLMYLMGITVLTLIVSDYIEYRFYRRERILTGRWRHPMKNHIVILNTPKHGGELYFIRLADQIRAVPGYETVPIQVLTRQYPEGLPAEVRDAGIVHFHGSGSDAKALHDVSITDAHHIIVLAPDSTDPESDCLTFDIAHRLCEMNLGSRVTLECVRDENRSRYTQLGIRTVLRPVRTYPEIIVRAVVSPGSEKVLEDLFSYQRDHPHRYDLELNDLNWADIVSALVRHDIGTALAYIDHDDNVICYPQTTDEVEGKGLIVLVKSEKTPPVEELSDALNRYRAFLKRWHKSQSDSKSDKSPSSANKS